MKLRAISLLVILCVLNINARPDETYTDKFDNVNVDEILSNKRMLGNYVNCLLETGRCSPDAAELKSKCFSSKLHHWSYQEEIRALVIIFL